MLTREGLMRLWAHITSKLNTKVDKVEGKGLSTEDFTTEEKEKLAAMREDDIYVGTDEPDDPNVVVWINPEGTADIEPYILPAATANTLGGVKIGKGLTVDADGTVATDVTRQDIDEYLETITIVQDASLGVDKFTDEAKKHVIKDYVTPEMHGAHGDGVRDDTEAVQAAINSGKRVEMNGNYLITAPLTLTNNTHVSGIGRVIKKNSATDDEGVNAIFVIRGKYISIDGIAIIGDGDTMTNGLNYGVDGIVVADGGSTYTSHLNFSRLKIQRCRNAITSISSFVMATFTDIHCLGCGAGLIFDDESDKTSILIERCYVANCGNAYALRRAHYSTLTDCAADACNCYGTSEAGQWGDIGHGDPATARGVYSFMTCRNVTVRNCGTERCCGNGAVYSNGSMIAIDGLTVVDLHSHYLPTENDYANYPKMALGAIYTTTAISRMSIDNLQITSYTNEAVEALADTADARRKIVRCAIACNSDTNAKNDNGNLIVPANTRLISLGVRTVASSLSLWGGVSGNVYRCYDVMTADIEAGYSKRLAARQITCTKTEGGNVLTIPIIPDASNVAYNIVELRGVNSHYQLESAKAFRVMISVASVDSIKEATVIEQSDEAITVSKSGLNLKVALPNYYNYLCVAGDVYGKYVGVVDWYSATLS